MAQVPHVTISAATSGVSIPGSSAWGAEKDAASSTSPSTMSTRGPAPAPPGKPRSCVICRSRKVRCNKDSPCSNCRRANTPCVFPSADRPLRWARRFDRFAGNPAAIPEAIQDDDPGVGQVMERLRDLERLVTELRNQLAQAHAAAQSTGSSPHDSAADHQERPNSDTSNVQRQFGRLVLNDASRSRYVSSGFWSRVNDEIDGLKMEMQELSGIDSDVSGDETSLEKTPSTLELERTPSERHAFLFRHSLNASRPDLCGYRPLPSQVPFLLDVFSENVNIIIQIVHMPTIKKMARSSRGNETTNLPPANEALMFSIYYAAITSMEEDDILRNFGSTKSDLNLKYRLGLEFALAQADFLNTPDIVLVQALAIFLFLVRRHDSPRFVWMMTGLVIRMAQALGLQRDGSHFDNLTPFVVEMRRRVWWALCLLDVRSSEDQGTDYTISSGSFDTKLPANVNDADMSPDMKQTPIPREELTDATFAIVSYEICDIARRMMAPGDKDGPPGLEEQGRLLQEMQEKTQRGYLQYATESGNILYWVGFLSTRIVVAKMTLLTHLPVLSASPVEHLSDEVRDKLLVSAIEVAEHNHALNAERACRHWRWVYQTYTHWHAIVYILIEASRRPWSSIVERAWVALHSVWLIPAQSNVDKSPRIWVPLRKLMTEARKRRDAELVRLRGDSWAAQKLEAEDRKLPLPASAGPFSADASADIFLERWRKLLTEPDEPEDSAQRYEGPRSKGPVPPSPDAVTSGQHKPKPSAPYSNDNLDTDTSFQAADFHIGPGYTDTRTNFEAAVPIASNNSMALGQAVSFGAPYNNSPSAPLDWTDSRSGGYGDLGWLWADSDPTIDVFANVDVDAVNVAMDLDGDGDRDVDWLNWVESAKGMERDIGP